MIIKTYEIFVLFQIIISVNSLNSSDACIVNYSKEVGVCQFIEDCPAIKKALDEQSVQPTSFGLKENKQTFCCPTSNTLLLSDREAEKGVLNNILFIFN